MIPLRDVIPSRTTTHALTASTIAMAPPTVTIQSMAITNTASNCRRTFGNQNNCGITTLHAIISQKNSGVKCFYVAAGQKDSTVANIIEAIVLKNR